MRHIGVSVEYELLRQFILQPFVGYYDDKFDGIPRDDRITSVGLEGKYLLSHNFALYGGYTYQQRTTNATGRDFNDNLVTLGVRSQL